MSVHYNSGFQAPRASVSAEQGASEGSLFNTKIVTNSPSARLSSFASLRGAFPGSSQNLDFSSVLDRLSPHAAATVNRILQRVASGPVPRNLVDVRQRMQSLREDERAFSLVRQELHNLIQQALPVSSSVQQTALPVGVPAVQTVAPQQQALMPPPSQAVISLAQHALRVVDHALASVRQELHLLGQLSFALQQQEALKKKQKEEEKEAAQVRETARKEAYEESQSQLKLQLKEVGSRIDLMSYELALLASQKKSEFALARISAASGVSPRVAAAA